MYKYVSSLSDGRTGGMRTIKSSKSTNWGRENYNFMYDYVTFS